jgi:hypothetical protein
MGCGNQNCYFSMLYFIPFNVDILSQKLKTNNNLSFQKAINCLLNDSIILSEEKNIKCYNCNKITAHKESKKFYHTAKNLMIIFDRGENFEHKQFIDFDEQLFLSQKEVERYNEVKYTLMGIITKIDNEYVSFILSENNKWASNRGIDNGVVFSFNDVKKKHFADRSIFELEIIFFLLFFSSKNISERDFILYLEKSIVEFVL